MKQAVLLIDCYLYGTIAILAVVLLVLVYLHGQANHLPNPFARKNIVYRPAPKARGVLLGKKYGLLAYSPEPDEGHIIVMGPSGTGKTSALLIPTLRIRKVRPLPLQKRSPERRYVRHQNFRKAAPWTAFPETLRILR